MVARTLVRLAGMKAEGHAISWLPSSCQKAMLPGRRPKSDAIHAGRQNRGKPNPARRAMFWCKTHASPGMGGSGRPFTHTLPSEEAANLSGSKRATGAISAHFSQVSIEVINRSDSRPSLRRRTGLMGTGTGRTPPGSDVGRATEIHRSRATHSPMGNRRSGTSWPVRINRDSASTVNRPVNGRLDHTVVSGSSTRSQTNPSSVQTSQPACVRQAARDGPSDRGKHAYCLMQNSRGGVFDTRPQGRDSLLQCLPRNLLGDPFNARSEGGQVITENFRWVRRKSLFD